MYELKITVTKVMGKCTADVPVKPGDSFTVRDGAILIPEGGFVCLWSLSNLLPLLPTKERDVHEAKDDDWMWRVHHVQCPDPDGRVIYKIERIGKLGEKDAVEPSGSYPEPEGKRKVRVVVEEVRGKCTSGMRTGDFFHVCEGRLTIPAGRHFCLYAIQAVLPFVAACQRKLDEDDWLRTETRMICPDPAGNVVMRIERSDR